MRIAIVNDSPMAIEVLRRTIEATARHQVCWLARNGAEAVKACEQDRPDLILMDLVMPVMDGVEATRRIMAATPCIILVVTASVDGRAGKVFEALGAGALDAASTPVFGAPRSENALLLKLATMSRLLGSERQNVNGSKTRRSDADCAGELPLFALGASAGGPAALATVLTSLPRNFPGAIVVVQHLDAQFARSMADWLNGQSALPVQLACEGDKPQAGQVLLAGRAAHLVFKQPCVLGYQAEPADLSSIPSIDIFFESVIGNWKGPVTGVILTGMGRDGARGLRALRHAGARTIVQDRATSVVYGMPKAALEAGAAQEVLPLERIADALVEMTEFHRLGSRDLPLNHVRGGFSKRK